MRAVLRRGKITTADLAKATGLSDRQIRNYLRETQFPPQWWRREAVKYLRQAGARGDLEALLACESPGRGA